MPTGVGSAVLRSLAAGATVAVLIAAVDAQEGANALEELGDYSIAFTSDRSGADEIWAIEADGSGLRQLTHTGSSQGDGDPSWSPDGRRIAFNTYRFGGWKLGVMAADGSDVRRLTDNARSVYEGSAEWSPSGTHIAFMRYRSEQGIWVAAADGTGARRLIDNGTSYYTNAQPSWAPDGQSLLYVSRVDGHYDIWTVRVDGSGARPISQTGADDLSPLMSPDGSRILFYSNRTGPFETYVMDADGGNVVPLTSSGGNSGRLEEGPSGADSLNPSWSPDGRFIAYVQHGEHGRAIWIARPDGSGARRLSDDLAENYDPTWIRR